MEVLIVSGVSILNFSALRNLFRLLRSSIGLHLLFGTVVKAQIFLIFDQFYYSSIFDHQLMQCLQQVEVPMGIYLAAYDGW